MKTKHTPGPWLVAYGAVYRGEPSPHDECGGIRIALMDRSEPHTIPTERDANDPEDWSALDQLTNQARAVLAKLDGERGEA